METKTFRIGVKRKTGTIYTDFTLRVEEGRDESQLVYGLDEAVLSRFPDAEDWSFMTPTERTVESFGGAYRLTS